MYPYALISFNLVSEDFSRAITFCMYVKCFSTLLFIKFNEAVRKDVKMVSEMKVKCNQKLNTLIMSKTENNSFLSKEKYDLFVHQINTQKQRNRKNVPKDYELLKRYDVVQIGQVEKMIFPVAEGNFSLQHYVQIEELFNVIHEVHASIGHGSRGSMVE